MKKLAWIFLLLNIVTVLKSQSDTSYIPFVAYWEKGDEYTFQVTKLKKQWQKGRLVKNDSSTYTTNFKVLESTDSSYTISWSYETQLISDFNIPEDLMETISDYNITNVIYETTELGEFIGVTNWKELSNMVNELFGELSKIFVENEDIDKEKFEAALEPFKMAFSSKEGIESLVLSELQFFHFPFGLEYPEKEVLEYEELLPNLFGGNPIRGDAKLYFKEVDKENLRCTLIQEMTLNPDDTKSILTQLLKSMQMKDEEFMTALKDSRYEINDFNQFEYYYDPGIPIKIETKREARINVGQEEGMRLDKTIIELIR